jgi:hypothetical protein
MKKIKTLRILLPFMLLLFWVIGGCSDNTETLVLSANVTMTNWEQYYYESLGKWGPVGIYYEIENTGNVDIHRFDVYFEITCEDGTKYYLCDSHSKTYGECYPHVGEKFYENFWADLGGKKVTSVKMTGWYLENLEYGLKTRTSL